MNPFDWLLLAVALACAGIVLLLIDNIYQHGKGWASRLWKDVVDDDFPPAYNEICFTCNAVSCKGCRYDGRRI